MDSIGRLESVVVALAGLYLGGMTLVTAFFAFLSASAPGGGKYLVLTCAGALVTLAAFIVAWKLLSRPNGAFMAAGAVVIFLAALGPLSKAFGFSNAL